MDNENKGKSQEIFNATRLYRLQKMIFFDKKPADIEVNEENIEGLVIDLIEAFKSQKKMGKKISENDNFMNKYTKIKRFISKNRNQETLKHAYIELDNKLIELEGQIDSETDNLKELYTIVENEVITKFLKDDEFSKRIQTIYSGTSSPDDETALLLIKIKNYIFNYLKTFYDRNKDDIYQPQGVVNIVIYTKKPGISGFFSKQAGIYGIFLNLSIGDKESDDLQSKLVISDDLDKFLSDIGAIKELGYVFTGLTLKDGNQHLRKTPYLFTMSNEKNDILEKKLTEVFKNIYDQQADKNKNT